MSLGAFSAASLFVTKLRTRLSDDRIDDMFVLRSHFLAEKAEQKTAKKKRVEAAKMAFGMSK